MKFSTLIVATLITFSTATTAQAGKPFIRGIFGNGAHHKVRTHHGNRHHQRHQSNYRHQGHNRRVYHNNHRQHRRVHHNNHRQHPQHQYRGHHGDRYYTPSHH